MQKEANAQPKTKIQLTKNAKIAPSPDILHFSSARKFALARKGIVSFTIVDTQNQRYSFYGERQFVSASVVKAMLLACFLNNKATHHQTLTQFERAELKTMITLSDNDAADWVYQQVGNTRLDNLAKRLGMKHFSVFRWWTYAQLTTNDQALLMGQLKRAIYPPYYYYARLLLSSIVSWESWGIPEVARPLGWKVFFKGGWRGTSRGRLVHQVARLEKNGQVIVICIFTDGNPSTAYGEATIAGVTKRLLK